MDFALILVIATALSGVIWALDALFWRSGRLAADPAAKEPWPVEYSRAFFPILAIVLVLRSFFYEPYRIPSGSMTPTLLVGDFIFVNKFAYGLRLPVVNTKIVDLGEPERGDVVVFRGPQDPSINYIKRLIGLPGEVIRYEDNQLTIDGKPVPVKIVGPYNGPGQPRATLGLERLAQAEHEVLFLGLNLSPTGTFIVPEGHYFFMGDNRDNSADSRSSGMGFVSEENLVGRAERIWMNFRLPNDGGPLWSRIGDKIE